MTVYATQIKNAKASIARKGQAVTWRQLEAGSPSDPSKPWRPGATSQTDNPVKIIFLPLDRVGRETYRRLAGTEATTGSLYGLMASVDFQPSTGDVVLRGGDTLQVTTVNELSPDGTPILYIVEFDK